MELKVWVEGIQRIVCGVTETTTCQVLLQQYFLEYCASFGILGRCFCFGSCYW
jgi:hypothetical protein